MLCIYKALHQTAASSDFYVVTYNINELSNIFSFFQEGEKKHPVNCTSLKFRIFLSFSNFLYYPPNIKITVCAGLLQIKHFSQ